MSSAPRITCFLIPKPFTGHVGVIQANALRVLAALGLPVLVIGDEPGVAEAAVANGARHLPEIARNEMGTPRVDSAFDLARRTADTPYLCYLNADILLPRGFPETVDPLLDQAPRALFTGRRWNLDVTDSLAFDKSGWEALEAQRRDGGICPGLAAMDYFLFPSEAFQEMPAFVVGRPGWDNWMVYHAKAEGRPVVDLSPMVAVIHQNHDFTHLEGGEAEYRNGPESLMNRHLAGGYFHLLNLADATHRAREGRVHRRWWRLSPHLATRWALGLTTRMPRLRNMLRAVKRRWQGAPANAPVRSEAQVTTLRLEGQGPGAEEPTRWLDPQATHRLEPGSRIPDGTNALPEGNWGPFQPLAFLGEGGMGRVYKARDTRLDRVVAMKFIRGDDADLLHRFQVEARSQALIEHPHVCKVYEVGEIDGQAYIAIQFIEGKSLDEVRDDLALEEKVRIVLEVAEAIHAAHRQGIIHRDLKPANIMLERTDDGRWWPYVMDFGLARGAGNAGMTLSGVALGTPSFMPPEQALGRLSDVDRRSDVYSLGATLYQVLGGQPPFTGASLTELFFKVVHEDPRPLRKLRSSVPAELETIVAKCLEKEPQRRYDSAKALAEDLRRYLDGEVIQARPASVMYRIGKKLRKNRTLSAAILVSGLVALGFASWGIHATWTARRQTKLANHFALEVRSIEDIMQVAYLRPMHDIRPEKAKVRARMQRLRQEMAQEGPLAAGPGGHALGLGYLALGDTKQARMALQAAWDAGYRPPELGMSLGQALAEEFEAERQAAFQLPSEEREARMKVLRADLLRPATDLLSTYLGRATARRGGTPGYALAAEPGEPVQGLLYLRALLLHLQGQEAACIREAKAAFQQDPGIYDAKRLEAQALMIQAQTARDAGDWPTARNRLEAAGRALAEARDLARSDGALWRWEAERRMALASLGAGRDPLLLTERAYEASIAASREALICDPDDVEAMRWAAEAWHDMATYQLDGGQDNLPALREAKSLLDRALALDVGDGELWYLLGRVDYAVARARDHGGHGQAEDYDQAVQAYQMAQSRGRDALERSALACLFKALFLESHGEDPGPALEKAEALAQQARQVREDRFSLNTTGLVLDAVARWRLARGENPINQLSEARACFSTGYARYHAFASLRNLADAWLLEARRLAAHGGDPAPALVQARTAVENALPVGPTYFLSHLTLGEVLVAQARIGPPEQRAQRLREAREALAQAIRLNPVDPAAYQQLAEAGVWAASWGEPNGLAQAASALDAARREAGVDAGWWVCRADLWRAQAARSRNPVTFIRQGLEATQRALALNPSEARAWLVAGQLHALAGDDDAAHKAQTRAWALDATLRTVPF